MKTLLINNSTRRLTELLALIPGETTVRPWNAVQVSEVNNYDLIVLSGSFEHAVEYDHTDFKNEIQIIQETNKPLIGICYGCQLVAYAFGGRLKTMEKTHVGIREIEILDTHEKLQVYENHHWIIDTLPVEFRVTAQSAEGPEAIQHISKPIYGLQFHPEKDSVAGKQLFLNILKDCGLSGI